ncbi:MAG: hypothetical protein JNL54_22065 [Kineosporiaceae bacterium]|nr:hypothetical protein [Kineosporiaceae bacterium]
MGDVRSAWKDTGERFAALGASLKAHYEEQKDDDGEAAQRELRDAAKRFSGAVQDAVDALGSAAKDPAVKDDVRNVMTALAAALSATFAEVSEDLRRMAERNQGKPAESGEGTEEGAGVSGAPPPTTPASTLAEPPVPPGPSTAVAGESAPAAEPPRVEPWGTP